MGDAAPISLIELVDRDVAPAPEPEKKAAKPTKAPKKPASEKKAEKPAAPRRKKAAAG